MITWNDIRENRLPQSNEEVFVLAETQDLIKKYNPLSNSNGPNLWIYVARFEKSLGWDLFGTDNTFKVVKWAYIDPETRNHLSAVLGELKRIA